MYDVFSAKLLFMANITVSHKTSLFSVVRLPYHIQYFHHV